MTPRNWIADMNRFGLEQPPTWWLQRLSDFDDKLVIIPSRQQAVYRIARRAQFTRGIGPLAVLDNSMDTAMLARNRLVPVTTMIRYSTAWDIDSLLVKLRDRDTWRISGGPASGKSSQERAGLVADAIEKHEDQLAANERTRMRSDLDYRSRDAWRSYQARTGQRTRVASSPSAESSPSGSTGQAATGNRVILASA